MIVLFAFFGECAASCRWQYEPDGCFHIQHPWVGYDALRAAFGGCALYAAAAAKPDWTQCALFFHFLWKV